MKLVSKIKDILSQPYRLYAKQSDTVKGALIGSIVTGLFSLILVLIQNKSQTPIQIVYPTQSSPVTISSVSTLQQECMTGTLVFARDTNMGRGIFTLNLNNHDFSTEPRSDNSAEAEIVQRVVDEGSYTISDMPVWSSGGTKIAFVAIPNNTDDDNNGVTDTDKEIYILDITDANSLPERLTRNDVEDFGPRWANRDNSIIFVAERKPNSSANVTGNTQVLRINLDTDEEEILTFNPNNEDYGGDWHETGIIYSSQLNHSQPESFQLFFIEKTLVNTMLDSNRLPRLSPDGQEILFVGLEHNQISNDPTKLPQWYNIAIINRITDEVRYITHDPENNPIYDYSPTWSPNGNCVAFIRETRIDGLGTNVFYREIYVANADGSSPHRVTFTAADEEFPDWKS